MFAQPREPEPIEEEEEVYEAPRSIDWGHTIGTVCIFLIFTVPIAMGAGAWYLIHLAQEHVSTAVAAPAASSSHSRDSAVAVAFVMLLIVRSIWKSRHK